MSLEIRFFDKDDEGKGFIEAKESSLSSGVSALLLIEFLLLMIFLGFFGFGIESKRRVSKMCFDSMWLQRRPVDPLLDNSVEHRLHLTLSVFLSQWLK